MARQEWQTGKIAGIQYREHPTRKRGIFKDRYYRARYMVGGKRYIVPLGWSSEGWTEKNAFAELQRLRRNTKKGEGPSTLREEREQKEEERKQEEAEEKRNVAFSKYFTDSYSKTAENEKSFDSWRTEKVYYKHWIKPVLGKKKMKNISPLDLERVKKRMKDKGKAPRTIQYTLAIIRQVFNHAIKQGIVSDNPIVQVKMPKYENRRTRFLSQKEAEKLLTALKKKSVNLHDQCLLSLHTGMRAGEVFSLDWNDIDFDNGFIRVRGETAKSKKDRIVYMTKQVRSMFEGRKEEDSSGLVFLDRKGNKIKSPSRVFFRTVDELKLNKNAVHKRDKVLFHSLRHTFASWLAISGESLYNIKELLGHSTLALTERYSHLSPAALQGSVARFEKALEKKPEEQETEPEASEGGE